LEIGKMTLKIGPTAIEQNKGSFYFPGVGIGIDKPEYQFHLYDPDNDESSVQATVEKEDGTAEFRAISYHVSGIASRFTGYAARGTKAAPGSTQDGDQILRIIGHGYSWRFEDAAEIRFEASENWVSGSAYGTNIEFHAIPPGEINPRHLLTVGEMIDINPTKRDIDTVIRGDTEDYLVYADASEDKVGLGTNLPEYRAHIVAGTIGIMMERTGATTNLVGSAAVYKYTTSGDMQDGHGAGLLFAIEDDAGINNYIVGMQAIRNGADNTGMLRVIAREGGVERNTADFKHDEVIFNEDGRDVDHRFEASGVANALFIRGSDGKVGVWTNAPEGTFNVKSGESGAGAPQTWTDDLVIENSDNVGITLLSPATKSGHIVFGDPGSTWDGGVAYDHATGPRFRFWVSGTDELLLTSSVLSPAAAAGLNLGDATNYWNDVSYKTLTDRGCLGFYDEGVKMPDGSIVSDVGAIKLIKKHPTLKTPAGRPRMDYSTLPLDVFSPAPTKNGKKIGEDGAEMTALFSIMLGAIKELDGRLTMLENI
jgi:hypothetical protein